MQARVSRKLLDRLEGLPKPIREVAWKAQLRLCRRYRRLAAAGKPKVVVTTAIAREMVGFIWAIARMVQPRPAIQVTELASEGDRSHLTPLSAKRLAGGGARLGNPRHLL